jgi:hypothetical protein
MKASATAVRTPSGRPPVFKLAMHLAGIDEAKNLRALIIGNEQMTQSRPEKRILVLGATGSGKSTWVNGIANFLYGVQWTDPFRFKIVTEEDESVGGRIDQANSQTNFVTSYRFIWQPGFACDFNCTIIDTPGFADTRGIQRDELIVVQLKRLFETQGLLGADQLDAIALVVQASNVRLTAVQKYIFAKILSVFGKDAIENLLLVATFADGGEPPVLAAIQADKIVYRDYLKFNNSALFASTAGDDPIAKLFWDIGTSSYDKFFLLIKPMPPKSLTLTREVLRERENLQAVIEGIQHLIRQGVIELDEMEKEERILNQFKLDIEANREYTITIRLQKAEQVPSPPNRFVTNCIICNMTCHRNCSYKDDEDKIHCCAMRDGHCKVCPGKCFWREHKNQPICWEFKEVEEVRTADDLKRKYQGAVSGQANHQTMLANLTKKYNNVKAQLRKHVEDARRCVNRLGQIAARPNPLSETDYIDLLIQSEEQDKKSGWQQRVKYLQEARAFALTRAELVKPGEFTPTQFRQRRCG